MRNRRFAAVLFCFLLSGFSGLLYETVWTREFSLVFGASSLAVATVLAAYMGGLTAGAAIAGRWVDRVRRPILTYGLLELGIGAAALAVPFAIHASTALHTALLSRGSTIPQEGGLGSALFYLLTSFAILCVPTSLMGATLPLLARHAVRSDEQVGPRIGALYAINTAGAVAGTLATAFWILPAVGLLHTIWTGVAMNAVVFAIAALLSRGAPLFLGRPDGESRVSGMPLVLWIVFGAGVASFSYEVLWTRLLEHVLGGSVYSFATMLASFLVGIALGGAAAARLARTQRGSAAGLALTQLAAALLAIGAFLAMQHVPAWVTAIGSSTEGIDALLGKSAIAAAVLLPSTLCLGASFPFAVRALCRGSEEAASSSARVYSWNTAGAIAGSIGTGFFLLPILRFEGVVLAAALLNAGLGALAATLGGIRRPLVAAAAGVAVLLVVARPAPPWPLLRQSPVRLDTASAGTDGTGVDFFAVGRSSTVLLTQVQDGWSLTTNGLPESKIEAAGIPPGTSLATHWLGALPAFVPGGVRRELVIGLGGGVLIESVPSSVRRIDVIEIEPEVLAANRIVANQRAHDPLKDPRVHVWLNDARSALELSQVRYGGIVSQPSHPWTAGSANLYTRDFFELVHEHLRPGGVFVQWIGEDFVDTSLLKSLAATLLAVFHHVQLYKPSPRAFLFVCSDGPLDLESQVRAVVRADPVATRHLGIHVPEDLTAALVLDEAGVRRFSAGAVLTTDDRNLVATRSPLVRGILDRRLPNVLARLDPLPSRLEDLDVPYLTRRLCELHRFQTANVVAASERDPEVRSTALGELASCLGLKTEAEGYFREALQRDPGAATARFRLLEMMRDRFLAGDPAAESLATGLHGPELSVLAGWRDAAAGDWAALRGLDPALGAIGYEDPAHGSARELRALWRLAPGADKADADAALALIDDDPRGWTPTRIALRALAASRAGDIPAALISLRGLETIRHSDVRSAGYALRALDALPSSALSAPERTRLQEMFVARGGRIGATRGG